MKLTAKYSLYLLLVVMVCLSASCKKWLDVKPKDQVKDSELFVNENGFKEALSGVYATLTLDALYGRQMTFGLVGVLGGEWEFASNTYDADKNYTFTSTASIGRIDAVWNNMYFAIANANNLLENIDQKKNVFSGQNYNIIKGEALALRAFIHYDLLRVFGASYAENPNKIAIPYVKKYSDEVSPQLKVSEVLDAALADLEAAAELLKADPIYTGQVINIDVDNGYLINRQLHLNYYAVRGLQARIYLYKKDHAKALAAAREVIASGKFTWVKQDDITNKDLADLTFTPEHLFALNMVNLSTVYDNYFDPLIGGSNVFNLNKDRLLNSYYETQPDDYRYKYQFLATDAGVYYLRKYAQLTTSSWKAAYKNKLPLLRLSEMYLIAAESAAATDLTAAAGYVNTIRKSRGIAEAVINASNLQDAIGSEFRKEVIGEGQLFFYHKRLNHALIPYASDYNLISLKGYKLPMPVAEFENASGRVDNR